MQSDKIWIILLIIVTAFGCESNDASFSGETPPGAGGSMTRFAISGERLYVADYQTIQVFNIAENKFSLLNQVSVGFGLETIFVKGDFLYLGANDAMYIYSIVNRDMPEFVFRYSHVVSCDPVVVQGNRAYVTMRGGNRCNRGANALEILDISNPYEPKLIANYPMQSPHGLAVDASRLFICEGDAGLKFFDISDEKNIKLLHHITNIFSFDVIAHQGLLTVTGEDGIFQYRYRFTENNLTEISKIPVKREEI